MVGQARTSPALLPVLSQHRFQPRIPSRQLRRIPRFSPPLLWVYIGINLRQPPATEESPMKLSNRSLIILFAILFVVSGPMLSTARLQAQDDAWFIVRADYGYKSQRNDVTDILRDLISRGGVNGLVAVNNQTMGGDPAKGKDKSLHILGRNRRGEEREFSFNENSFVNARMFLARREDRDDRPPVYGRDRDRDRDGYNGYNGLNIIRAYYGVQGKTINVTDLLRGWVREGTLSVVVTSSAMGTDPALGYDKILIVVYSYQGVETATAVRE